MFKYKRFLILIFFILGVSCSLCRHVPQINYTYARIPVRFFPFLNEPLIRVDIENKKYSVLVDTGCSHHIDLNKKCIDKIKDKEFIDNFTSYDVKGNEYSLPGFRI